MVLHVSACSEASYSVQLSLLSRSMDAFDILDEARLYDGWAADSDSADSGEDKVDEAEAQVMLCGGLEAQDLFCTGLSPKNWCVSLP